MEPNPEKPDQEPGQESASSEHGRTEALRSAVRDTLAATSGPAAHTRDRAGNLIDELVRRGRAELERGRQEAGQLARKGQEATGDLARLGQEATGEIARRGQEAGGEIARRGQEAGGEIARRGGDAREELMRRFEAFETRLASIEDLLRRSEDRAAGEGTADSPPAAPDVKPDPGIDAAASTEVRPDPEDPPTKRDQGTSPKPEVEG
ncbi:hypothetical protein HJD18_11170 [Thermoleophilia bacterium SCSIO 60948]|nr:hypothetical protein HJD18_11170 [Thermoleophilia bacterium SCSIO 60948]